jgi:hypothetical protein
MPAPPPILQPRKAMSSKFLFMFLAGVATSAAAADVYKWVDAAGVVHYSDTEPPKEAKAQLVHLSGSGANAAEATADEAPAAPPKAADGTVVKSGPSDELQCERARNDLELLQGNGAVGLEDAKGGPAKPLDDASRQSQIARAQSLIATFCK